MEFQDVLLLRAHARLDGHLSQNIHHARNVHFVGAPGDAGLAGGAEPDGGAVQNFIFSAHLDHLDDLVDVVFHGKGQGTSGRAFPTVITPLEGHTVDFLVDLL
jgi:hypothetical protein